MTWRDNPEFNAALDEIYASFMARKAQVEGRPDAEIRDPQIILQVARDLALVPPPDRIVRVTGSKGKGTTARMIAHVLRKETNEPVGLCISPEEIDHNDRMRVDGVAPSQAGFIALYREIRPHLQKAGQNLTGMQYLSPSGIFLLIALACFRNANVAYWVLETGRGAQYDEVGNIPSKVSVVTSILNEHAASLGPDLADIARNKLFITGNSDQVVCTGAVADWHSRLGMPGAEKLLVPPPAAENAELPAWLETDKQLARAAAEALLGHPPADDIDLDGRSAAFGLLAYDGRSLYFDACVSLASLDRAFLSRLTRDRKIVFIASLPDDKDVDAIADYCRQDLNAPYFEIALSGTRGYLHYDRAKAAGRVAAEIHYEDTNGLRRTVSSLMAESACNHVYFLGTQTYIRLVKMAYASS